MFWQRLLRRWFIEYNPLYLLSATSLLVGVNKLSEALTRSPYNSLTVAAVAESYAWALLAGASFLTHHGLRRPAVMLVLLAALYQCDPTLHTETCAYLGITGVVATLAWFAGFVAKLYAMARALRVRLSRTAVALPVLGAFGVALLPHLALHVDASRLTSLVGFWLFVLFALAFSSSRRVISLAPLDSQGGRVLRRTVNSIWVIWGCLLLCHVFFWAHEFELKLSVLVPIVFLLRTRWASREFEVWGCVLAALTVGWFMPQQFFLVAGIAALALVLRAFRSPTESTHAGATDEPDAARMGVETSSGLNFALSSAAARTRLVTGAIYAVYLCVWTLGWHGGPMPQHAWVVDASLALALALLWRKTRSSVPAVPLAAVCFDLAVKRGLLFAPSTKLHWAVTYIALGFALLSIAIACSWQVKASDSEREPSDFS
ncbi:MAG: hypothetical protein ABW061_18995 [Polyangiaceae bacterium]